MEEFNLSKTRRKEGILYVYWEENVKEFIRREGEALFLLLSKGKIRGEEITLNIDDVEEFKQEREELAGSELNNTPKEK